MKRIISYGVLALSLLLPFESSLAQAPTHDQQIAALKAEVDKAETRVKAIVNQPVAKYPINTWLQLRVFSPGWFHPGASKPDYEKADVKRTQEFPYEKFDYVTSDVSPGVMFKGKDLEFNAMLKYYYTDRSLPKKRLTDAEMNEIDGLYRIIGPDQKKLAELEGAWLPFSNFSEFLSSGYGLAAQLLAIGIIGLIVYKMMFKQKRRY